MSVDTLNSGMNPCRGAMTSSLQLPNVQYVGFCKIYVQADYFDCPNIETVRGLMHAESLPGIHSRQCRH